MNDGWMKHLEASLVLNGSLVQLFVELHCWLYPQGPNREHEHPKPPS